MSVYADYIARVMPRWITERLDPYFASISATKAVSQAIARRLETPRGFLLDAPNECIDVRRYLNARFTPTTLNAFRAAILSEIKKDERVDSAAVTATINQSDATMNVRATGVSASGPFEFVLTVGDFSSQLSTGVTATGDPTLGAGTDVDTYKTLPDLPNDGLLYQWGERWLRGWIGDPADMILDLIRAAVRSSAISRAPDDALPYLGSESGLDQQPTETNDQFRTRLGDRWNAWQKAGTKASIVSQLEAYGLTNIEVFQANGDAWSSPTSTNWSRFWVVAHAPMPFTRTVWGSGTWGSSVTWGSTATTADVTGIRRIIRKWKAAHSIGVSIIFVFTEQAWEPSNIWGSGSLWGTGDVMSWPLARFWGDNGNWAVDHPWGSILD